MLGLSGFELYSRWVPLHDYIVSIAFYSKYLVSFSD